MSFLVSGAEKAVGGLIQSAQDTLSGHFGSAISAGLVTATGGMLGHLNTPGARQHMLGSIPLWQGGQSLPGFTNTVTNAGGGRGINEGDNTLHLVKPGFHGIQIGPTGGPVFQPGHPIAQPPAPNPVKNPALQQKIQQIRSRLSGNRTIRAPGGGRPPIRVFAR